MPACDHGAIVHPRWQLRHQYLRKDGLVGGAHEPRRPSGFRGAKAARPATDDAEALPEALVARHQRLREGSASEALLLDDLELEMLLEVGERAVTRADRDRDRRQLVLVD